MTEVSQDGRAAKRSNFFCGVVEGFYGRPWTTEQRKDLFQKLKKWNMDMYVYAPKDDYKHRAYWRELYTVEEAEHLTSLITAAKEQGVTFCYALSPGLDITYSSQKEIATLKRKLEQVAQFGCTCFALLFDDIEPEMTEADKQIFQTFAHAQVSVTNEVAQHLRAPGFLFCPTQYCSTRAMPNVNTSEYLRTLGGKLAPEIDILWTGPKVISKLLTVECIEEITEVLRRPPVIWDNLHANDYDQKRIFLGPYCGRSPELIPLLRGVLTNPNCEYNANMIAIRTLAHWASCDHLAPQHMESVSWDIKLEREGEQGVCEEEPPIDSSNNVYHPRQALRQAINEWLPEFMIPKTSQGPVIKPQPPVLVPSVPLLPIVPHVNTCMSLCPAVCTQSVSTSTSASNSLLTTTTSNLLSTPIMNSLVSPTKVILNDTIPNPIIPLASNISIPQQLPVSTLPIPVIGMKVETIEEERGDILSIGDGKKVDEVIDVSEQIVVDDGDEPKVDSFNGFSDVVLASPLTLSPSAPMSRTSPGIEAEPLDVDPPPNSDSDVVMNETFSENSSMHVEPSNSPLSTEMMVEPADTTEVVDESNLEVSKLEVDAAGVTADDLVLLCELFYLPFEHGARGLRLLHDFYWLSTHPTPKTVSHETSEWRRRRCRFAWWCSRARRLLKRLSLCENRELYTELAPYMWDLCTVLALLEGFVRWLELGKCPPNATMQTQTSYTWFSKGWREAFESGAQEPWVFRGGVTADLRRLLPVEMAGEIGRPSPLVSDLHPIAVIRMFMPQDELKVCEICHKTCRDGGDCSELFPSDLQTLPADRLVAPFLTLTPEFCMLIEDDHETPDPDETEDDPAKLPQTRINGVKPDIVGYACAALNSKEFYKRQEVAWIPEMCVKYPESLLERCDLSQAAQDCIRHFHSFADTERAPPHITSVYPSLLSCCVLLHIQDPRATQRLVTCLLAALRASGSNGVHVCINSTDKYLLQFYTKLGFTELTQEANSTRIYLGRSF